MTLQGRHTRSTVYVVGNGPSLRGVDLDALSREITIGCNEAPLVPGGFTPTVWTVEDTEDWRQFRDRFAGIGALKVVPEDLTPPLPGSVCVPFVRAQFGDRADGAPPAFGFAPPFYWGATVSYLMLQIAAWLGAAEVRLLGQDFSWEWAPDDQVNTTHVLSGAEDRNHFAAGYWPQGTRSFTPVPSLMRTAFVAARAALEGAGVRVVNLTEGTKLDVFDCAPMPDALRRCA